MICISVGKPFDVVCSFNNPLNTPMTNIEWIVEGAGLIKPDIVKIKGQGASIIYL